MYAAITIRRPKTSAYYAIAQISPTAPSPGVTRMITTNNTEAAPESPMVHSLSISLRNRIAPMIWKMPSTIAQVAMKMSSSSGQARPHERQDAGRDPREADEREPPAVAHVAAHEGIRERQHAVDQREGAPEQHERDECDAGPGEGEHAEDDRGDAAQQQQPPVSSECLHQRRAGGHRRC